MNFTETPSSEMTDNIFNNSIEANSDTAVNNAGTATTENNTTVAPLSATEPKQQRVGIKQRKMESHTPASIANTSGGAPTAKLII